MTQTFLSAAIPLRNQKANPDPVVQGNARDKFLAKLEAKYDTDSTGWDLYTKSHTKQMFGVCTVRDLQGNRHFASTSADYNVSKYNRRHVEDWLQEFVCEYYNKSGTGLTSAKVAFYMPASPCVACTNSIPGWVDQMRKAITGTTKSNSVFFVFNFIDYYTTSVSGDPGKIWGSEKLAKDAYGDLMALQRTNTLTDGSGKTFTVPVINFRQAASVANGSPTFGKLANKNAVP